MLLLRSHSWGVCCHAMLLLEEHRSELRQGADCSGAAPPTTPTLVHAQPYKCYTKRPRFVKFPDGDRGSARVTEQNFRPHHDILCFPCQICRTWTAFRVDRTPVHLPHAIDMFRCCIRQSARSERLSACLSPCPQRSSSNMFISERTTLARCFVCRLCCQCREVMLHGGRNYCFLA